MLSQVVEGHTGGTDPKDYWQELADNRAKLICLTLVRCGRKERREKTVRDQMRLPVSWCHSSVAVRPLLQTRLAEQKGVGDTAGPAAKVSGSSSSACAS